MPQCKNKTMNGGRGIRRSPYCSDAMPMPALSAASKSTLLAVNMRENMMQFTIRCSYKGNVLSCMLFSNADCSLSGEDCATLHEWRPHRKKSLLLRGDALASVELCRLVNSACFLHAREPDADCNTLLLQRKRVVLHAAQQCGLLAEWCRLCNTACRSDC